MHPTIDENREPTERNLEAVNTPSRILRKMPKTSIRQDTGPAGLRVSRRCLGPGPENPWSIATTFPGPCRDRRPEDVSEEVRPGRAPGQARTCAGGNLASSVSTKRRKCGSLVFSSSGSTLPRRSNAPDRPERRTASSIRRVRQDAATLWTGWRRPGGVRHRILAVHEEDGVSVAFAEGSLEGAESTVSRTA